MRPTIVSLAAALAIATTAGGASASAPSAEASPVMVERWYGWQIALTAAASYGAVGLVLASEARRDDNGYSRPFLSNTTEGVFVAGAIGGYLFGGPIVHWAHGFARDQTARDPSRTAAVALETPLHDVHEVFR